ncbi:hypothetical protein L829_1121 [Mycobacteroides abscessus MAB_030201_1075]|uniref:Uncharacterized protein n=1 Tax=Mycobacteroides abscessus MAB_030201_1075 TaxID=1335410 RepID=A0A829PHC4_9MYCO|nr:hypothetical protein [Mycobacteroides abscessus]ETZ70224.1 hypothetical protein L835_3138 [Mycobacteroides abscessus MAB_110811_1470]ETZ87573.1 hypothetical protein L829_1121 [Mycobacteroides abscessus MAB_030201_1075]ETZ95839.1 hypothetical protein L828_3208 [Mycobacteroides abscessus MAB_030201_1061]
MSFTLTLTYDTGALHMSSHDDLKSAHAALTARFSTCRIDGYPFAGVVMFDTIHNGVPMPRRVATYKIA